MPVLRPVLCPLAGRTMRPSFSVDMPPPQPGNLAAPCAGHRNDADGVGHGRAQAALGFHCRQRCEQSRVAFRVEHCLALAVAAEIDAGGRVALDQPFGHGPGEGGPQQPTGIPCRALAARDTRQSARAGLDFCRSLAVADRREGAPNVVLLQAAQRGAFRAAASDAARFARSRFFVCARTFCVISRACDISIQQAATVNASRAAALSASGSPPPFTLRDMPSAMARACSGVSAPTLPMVARRVRPSAVRNWKTNDFVPLGNVSNPKPGSLLSHMKIGLRPARAASTDSLRNSCHEPPPDLGARVSTM